MSIVKSTFDAKDIAAAHDLNKCKHELLKGKLDLKRLELEYAQLEREHDQVLVSGTSSEEQALYEKLQKAEKACWSRHKSNELLTKMIGYLEEEQDPPQEEEEKEEADSKEYSGAQCLDNECTYPNIPDSDSILSTKAKELIRESFRKSIHKNAPYVHLEPLGPDSDQTQQDGKEGFKLISLAPRAHSSEPESAHIPDSHSNSPGLDSAKGEELVGCGRDNEKAPFNASKLRGAYVKPAGPSSVLDSAFGHVEFMDDYMYPSLSPSCGPYKIEWDLDIQSEQIPSDWKKVAQAQTPSAKAMVQRCEAEVMVQQCMDKFTPHCQHCKQTETNGLHLLQCSKCKKTRYCSKACQKQDWTFHKGLCKRIWE